MKKNLILICTLLLLIITGCRSQKIVLTSPDYDAFALWGEHPPYVFENKEYAVITTSNSFFLYDKSQNKITKAYGIDPDKNFSAGFWSELAFDTEKNIIIIYGINGQTNFKEYHIVYDIKTDNFKKVKGEGKLSKISNEDTVKFDKGIMSSDLNTVYFISAINGKKIYPFKDNFNKEDFNIKN